MFGFSNGVEDERVPITKIKYKRKMKEKFREEEDKKRERVTVRERNLIFLNCAFPHVDNCFFFLSRFLKSRLNTFDNLGMRLKFSYSFGHTMELFYPLFFVHVVS